MVKSVTVLVFLSFFRLIGCKEEPVYPVEPNYKYWKLTTINSEEIKNDYSIYNPDNPATFTYDSLELSLVVFLYKSVFGKQEQYNFRIVNLDYKNIDTVLISGSYDKKNWVNVVQFPTSKNDCCHLFYSGSNFKTADSLMNILYNSNVSNDFTDEKLILMQKITTLEMLKNDDLEKSKKKSFISWIKEVNTSSWIFFAYMLFILINGIVVIIRKKRTKSGKSKNWITIIRESDNSD